MESGTIRIAQQSLQSFVEAVFAKAGMPQADAATQAEVLVWANLRGVDSHGVLRIPSYLDMIDKGMMNPRPRIRTLAETPAVLFIDADRAMGPVVTTFAMNQAIDKARNVGIGWVLMKRNTHQGAMAYYAEMAAREGMVGIAIVCSPPNMAPYGAKSAGLHNSPIAIAVPSGQDQPLVLDMSTSIAAAGKLTLAMDQGVSIPDTWALDADGNPTTDPAEAKVLQPAGGPKGSGLALMFQCLTSQMAANPLLLPVLREQESPWCQNSVVAAVDIGLFTELETYGQGVDELVTELKALRRTDGCDEILMPGEPEQRVRDDRDRNGFPIPPGTAQKLQDAAARLGLDLPSELRASP